MLTFPCLGYCGPFNVRVVSLMCKFLFANPHLCELFLGSCGFFSSFGCHHWNLVILILFFVATSHCHYRLGTKLCGLFSLCNSLMRDLFLQCSRCFASPHSCGFFFVIRWFFSKCDLFLNLQNLSLLWILRHANVFFGSSEFFLAYIYQSHLYFCCVILIHYKTPNNSIASPVKCMIVCIKKLITKGVGPP